MRMFYRNHCTWARITIYENQYKAISPLVYGMWPLIWSRLTTEATVRVTQNLKEKGRILFCPWKHRKYFICASYQEFMNYNKFEHVWMSYSAIKPPFITAFRVLGSVKQDKRVINLKCSPLMVTQGLAVFLIFSVLGNTWTVLHRWENLRNTSNIGISSNDWTHP